MGSSKIQEYNLDPNCGFAKEDTAQEILSQMGQGVTANVVKSVQRGTTQVQGNADVTIASVNVNKAFVNVQSSTAASSDFTGAAMYQYPPAGGYLKSPTVLHLYAGAGMYVAWEVIEFY